MLTDSQYEELEKLAAINYSPEKMALYFGVDKDRFIAEFNDKESKVFYHYEVGLTRAHAVGDMANFENAKGGNVTAYQAWKKEAHFNQVENAKRRALAKTEMEKLDQLRSLMERGRSDMPADAEEYYFSLDLVRSMTQQFSSKNMVINALMKSFNLSRYAAVKRYNEALNFFYLDIEVKAEAWANIYAEKLDIAIDIAFEQCDWLNYHKMIKLAAELKGVFKQTKESLPDDFYDRRPIIYNIDASQFGLKPADRKKLGEFIDNLPDIQEADKIRLKRDMDPSSNPVLPDEPETATE